MTPRLSEAALAAAVAEGRAAWPSVALATPAFGAWLAERASDDAELSRLPVADLYLACACAVGDASALAAFDDRYLREVEIAAAKVRAAPGILDEARQVVRELLFVSRGDRRPAITTYVGRGDLRGWIRVIAMREVMRLCERDPREVTTGDEELLEALSPADDPELELLKAGYRDQFARAFRAAVHALAPRQRTLLRQQLIDGVRVKALAKLHGVHPATVARWLAEIREVLVETTRERLADALQLSRGEVDSVLRLIRSRIDVSVDAFRDKPR